MSRFGGSGGYQDSDDKRNKVTGGGGKETVSLPASLEDDRTDVQLAELKKMALENLKLLNETTNHARRNQTLFEINAHLFLAQLQRENKRLVEEVITQTKKTNDALANLAELYEKLIEVSEPVGSDCEMANSPDNTKA